MKGLIFDAESVRGILTGTKSQTRRVIPVERYGIHFVGSSNQSKNDPSAYGVETEHGEWCMLGGPQEPGYSYNLPCRYGLPGDVLYVKETFYTDECDCHGHHSDCRLCGGRGEVVVYRATSKAPEAHRGRWRSPLFLPERFARIKIRLTDVRVERLQEISEADAKAEGVLSLEPRDEFRMEGGSYRLGYQERWQAINAKRGYPWESDPWVWALAFERAEP